VTPDSLPLILRIATEEDGKGMRGKRETAKELDQWILIFSCYAEFLRYHFYNRRSLTYVKFQGRVRHFYKDGSLLTGYRDTLLTGIYPQYASTEVKIRSFLEREYQNVIKEYSEKFEKGDTKGISIIINALGINAFDEKWVIKGMKNLFLEKGFKIPRLKAQESYSDLFKEMRKLEKRANKSPHFAGAVFDDANISTVKTRYFREFPRKAEIFRIYYLYRLLHKPHHEYALKKIPPYTSLRTFKKHISRVEKVLS
jgi:hypothetical protein